VIKARAIWTITAVAGALAVASPASAEPGDPLPGGDPAPIPAVQDDSPPPPYQEGDPLPGGDPAAIAAALDDTPPAPQEGDPLPGGDPAPITTAKDDSTPPAPQEGDPLPGGDPDVPLKMVAAAYVGETTKQFKRVSSRHRAGHARHRRLHHKG
jgi:hypothetical protein